jgi:hypothetical protein
VRVEDDLLWESSDQSDWGMRCLRHVVVAVVLAGFGALCWRGDERAVSAVAFCVAPIYATWVTGYWLQSWRSVCPEATLGDTRRSGSFDGYSY